MRRPGAEKPLEFVGRPRQHEPEETVLGCRRDDKDSWNYWIDADKKIGYVRLAGMADDTCEVLEKVLGVLRKEGIKALVLDLRYARNWSLMRRRRYM